MKLSILPSAASWNGLRKSSPLAKARKGLCRLTFGIQGIRPRRTSSICRPRGRGHCEAGSPSQADPAGDPIGRHTNSVHRITHAAPFAVPPRQHSLPGPEEKGGMRQSILRGCVVWNCGYKIAVSFSPRPPRHFSAISAVKSSSSEHNPILRTAQAMPSGCFPAEISLTTSSVFKSTTATLSYSN